MSLPLPDDDVDEADDEFDEFEFEDTCEEVELDEWS